MVEAEILRVERLNKKYLSFSLKDVSFSLKEGYIMGFIGANGAGKSTTLKSILNLVKPDSGTVTIMGKNFYENEILLKQKIGFMLGGVDYYIKMVIKKIVKVYKRFYAEWDDTLFESYLQRFNIDPSKKVCELSAGMRTKLNLAMCMSHGSSLLILDEPTSGLDPVARDELLDIFQEIVSGGDKSILFSTHITSDLDKCADFIIFIRNGEIVANTTKDDLLESHILVHGKLSELTKELKGRMINYKQTTLGFTGLMLKNKLQEQDGLICEKPNLEDIMVYFNKEKKL